MGRLKKVILDGGSAQLSVVVATDVVQESMERTQALPPAALHLGQGLMAAMALTSVSTKETDGQLSLQWQTDGPFGELYIEASPNGNLRGTILKPQANVEDLGTLLGSGQLQVRKNFRSTSSGIVTATGSICDDVLGYLNQSEQRTCAMNLWVDLKWNDDNKENPISVDGAYAYLFELLPETDANTQSLKADLWEQRFKELGPLSGWDLDRQNPADSIIQTIIGPGISKEILDQKINFHCNCSEDRAKRALSLAVDQTSAPHVETEIIRCEFCGKTYELTPSLH